MNDDDWAIGAPILPGDFPTLFKPDPHTAPPHSTAPTWAETVRECTDEDREWLTERAAIREHDGLQSRAEAEAGAWEDYRRWKCASE